MAGKLERFYSSPEYHELLGEKLDLERRCADMDVTYKELAAFDDRYEALTCIRPFDEVLSEHHNELKRQRQAAYEDHLASRDEDHAYLATLTPEEAKERIDKFCLDNEMDVLEQDGVVFAYPKDAVPDDMATEPPVIRMREVCALTGVSSNTIRRWVECEGFPRSRKLASNTVVWDRAAVTKWLATRDAGSE